MEFPAGVELFYLESPNYIGKVIKLKIPWNFFTEIDQSVIINPLLWQQWTHSQLATVLPSWQQKNLFHLTIELVLRNNQRTNILKHTFKSTKMGIFLSFLLPSSSCCFPSSIYVAFVLQLSSKLASSVVLWVARRNHTAQPGLATQFHGGKNHPLR